MKKTLIALSLLAFSGAAAAEVVLYGAVKGGVEWERGYEWKQNGQTVGGERAFKVADYGSHIGFKGSENLGNGLNAVWQIETRANIGGGEAKGLGTRDSFIGLEGGFGRITAGHQASPLKQSLDKQDIWEYSNYTLGLLAYSRYGYRATGISYQSPNWGGFDFSAQFVPGNNSYGGNNADSEPTIGLGLNYAHSGFFARYALEYALRDKERHGGKDAHIHNLVGGYDANNLYLALGLQYAKNVYPYFITPNNVTRSINHSANDVYGSATINVGGVVHNLPYTATLKEAQLSAAYTFGALTPKLSVAYGTGSGVTIPALNNRVFGKNARYLQVVAGADYAFSRRTTGLVTLGWFRGRNAEYNPNETNWAVGTGLVHKF
ncbi:MAG: porin [Eikenella sp.]|nr:porin [Eikenella sp.]